VSSTLLTCSLQSPSSARIKPGSRPAFDLACLVARQNGAVWLRDTLRAHGVAKLSDLRDEALRALAVESL
jgi:hypothetical protein